eukprot:758014-Pelagomonas_calceolata.AAC.1
MSGGEALHKHFLPSRQLTDSCVVTFALFKIDLKLCCAAGGCVNACFVKASVQFLTINNNKVAPTLSTMITMVPMQVRLLTINDEVAPYAHEVAASMKKQGIRAKVEGGASISKLVRNATTAKTPVICIIGRQASAGSHLHCCIIAQPSALLVGMQVLV